jgi:hypothetical protein
MCRCVGKPILIQSLARDDIASNKAFEKLSFDEFSVFDMYDDGEYFWFTAIEFNALFKIKKATWKTEFVGCFPDENILGWRLYTSITENNGKLYFTPCSAREIGVYDIVANQFEKINIGITKTDNDASKLEYFKKFISGFIYDDKLILIPCRFDKMVIYDIKTGELSNSTEMVDYFKSKYRGSVTSFDAQFDLCWFARWINKSEIVFNLHCNKNIAVIVNLETGEFNEYNVGNKCRTYSLIECCGDIIWLYDAPQDILVRWNNRADTYEEIDISDRLPEFKPCGPDNSFVNMISLGDQLFLVPANTNVAINVNTVTLEVAIMKELTSECLLTADGIAFYNLAKTSDNKLYLFGNKSKSFICFDRVTGELERVKVIAPDGDGIRNAFEQERFLNSLTDSNHTLSDEQVSLPNFLDIFDNAMCKNKECIVAKSDLNEGNAGKNIYDHVRRIGLGKQLSGGKDIHANYL